MLRRKQNRKHDASESIAQISQRRIPGRVEGRNFLQFPPGPSPVQREEQPLNSPNWVDEFYEYLTEHSSKFETGNSNGKRACHMRLILYTQASILWTIEIDQTRKHIFTAMDMKLQSAVQMQTANARTQKCFPGHLCARLERMPNADSTREKERRREGKKEPFGIWLKRSLQAAGDRRRICRLPLGLLPAAAVADREEGERKSKGLTGHDNSCSINFSVERQPFPYHF